MTRAARKIVIFVRAYVAPPAFGLERDDRLAQRQRGEMKGIALHQRIVLDRAPAFQKIGAQGFRQRSQRLAIGCDRPCDAAMDQRLGQIGRARHVITRLTQVGQDRRRRGESVQPDRMRRLPVLARIGRQQDRQPPLRRRGRRQPGPARHPVGDRRDARGLGAVEAQGDVEIGIALARLLEADHAREQPSVDLGQHDVHGEIGGRQPRAEPSQPARSLVASAIWNTGTPAPSSGVVSSSPRAEKAVALTIAEGVSAATSARSRGLRPRLSARGRTGRWGRNHVPPALRGGRRSAPDRRRRDRRGRRRSGRGGGMWLAGRRRGRRCPLGSSRRQGLSKAELLVETALPHPSCG